MKEMGLFFNLFVACRGKGRVGIEWNLRVGDECNLRVGKVLIVEEIPRFF